MQSARPRRDLTGQVFGESSARVCQCGMEESRALRCVDRTSEFRELVRKQRARLGEPTPQNELLRPNPKRSAFESNSLDATSHKDHAKYISKLKPIIQTSYFSLQTIC